MRGLYGLSGYGSMFGSSRSSSMVSLYGSLSQYSSVRAGSYSRAARAYYTKFAKAAAATKSAADSADRSSAKRTSSDLSQKYGRNQTVSKAELALSDAKKEATELVNSASKLMKTGKDSLFSNQKEYDKDAVFQAVQSFVSEYNDAVSALDVTSNSYVKNAGNSMTRMTDIMSNSLSKVGITIGEDGKLSIDEDTFKKADAGRVKALFNGSGSYAGIVSSSASRIASQAGRELSGLGNGLYGSGLYGSGGSYYNNYNFYNRGMLYNGFF